MRQARDRLADWDVGCGVVAAGWAPEPDLPVQVASVQSLARREFPRADVVVVDECHHVRARTWQRVVDHYADAGACVLGLTATPYRLDGRGLGHAFGAIVEPVTVAELCESGLLVAPRVLAPVLPDMQGARVARGDFRAADARPRMSKLTGDVVDHWRRHATGRRCVLFAVDVAHSLELVEALSAAGCRAAHLDGSTPRANRDEVLAALARGDLDLVSNCMVLTEGWDLPSLDCAVVARPTASLGLHRQMIGRVMRACDDKDGALVLDHAGNHHRHGLVTDEVEVSLDDRARRAGAGAGLNVATCSECYAVSPPGTAVCPECGAPIATPQDEPARRDRPRAEDGDLVLFEGETRADRSAWYREVVREASASRRRLGWARYRFRDRYGVWPSSRRGIGRDARAAEDEYACPGFEARQGRWGVRCGRCYRARDEHEPQLAEAAWRGQRPS